MKCEKTKSQQEQYKVDNPIHAWIRQPRMKIETEVRPMRLQPPPWMKSYSIKHMTNGWLFVLKNLHVSLFPNDPYTSQPDKLKIKSIFLSEKVSPPN